MYESFDQCLFRSIESTHIFHLTFCFFTRTMLVSQSVYLTSLMNPTSFNSFTCLSISSSPLGVIFLLLWHIGFTDGHTRRQKEDYGYRGRGSQHDNSREGEWNRDTDSWVRHGPIGLEAPRTASGGWLPCSLVRQHRCWYHEPRLLRQHRCWYLLAILQELQVQSCIFVGHSLSAMVGLLASISHPHLFTKLILVSASPR